eukprot:gene19599-24015_t
MRLVSREPAWRLRRFLAVSPLAAVAARVSTKGYKALNPTMTSPYYLFLDEDARLQAGGIIGDENWTSFRAQLHEQLQDAASDQRERLQLLRPFAPRLCAALCVMAVTVGIQLVYPRALSYFIDNVNTQRSSEWYTGLALTMLAILTAQAAASTLRYYLFETTGYMIVTRAR